MHGHNDSDRFPSRKNPRLTYFDYASVNYYFVTICTWHKQCIFGSPDQLNTYGKIAKQGLLAISSHFPDIEIDKYVIMPNHVHAIVIIKNAGTNLSTVLGQYKAHVSKQIHTREPNRKVWQTSFHDHIIRSQAAYEKIWLYIDGNPNNWEKDCFYLTSYTEQSASAGS